MTTAIEAIPAEWSAADEDFFRIVGVEVLTPEFLFGAGALLASYDVETLPEPLDVTPAANPREHIGTGTSKSAGRHGPTPGGVATATPMATMTCAAVRGFGCHSAVRSSPETQSHTSALVAQGIEHRFPKPCVAGSNPAGGTRVMSQDIGIGPDLHFAGSGLFSLLGRVVGRWVGSRVVGR